MIIFQPTLINKKGKSTVQSLFKMDHLAFKWNWDNPILLLLGYEKRKGLRTIQSLFKNNHHIFKWNREDPILWLLGSEKRKGQRTIQSSLKNDHHLFKWNREDPILWLLGYEKYILFIFYFFYSTLDSHIINFIFTLSSVEIYLRICGP